MVIFLLTLPFIQLWNFFCLLQKKILKKGKYLSKPQVLYNGGDFFWLTIIQIKNAAFPARARVTFRGQRGSRWRHWVLVATLSGRGFNTILMHGGSHGGRTEQKQIVDAWWPPAASAHTSPAMVCVWLVWVSRWPAAVGQLKIPGGCGLQKALLKLQLFEVIFSLLAVEILADDCFGYD